MLLCFSVQNPDKEIGDEVASQRLALMDSFRTACGADRTALAITREGFFSDIASALLKSGELPDGADLRFILGFDSLVRCRGSAWSDRVQQKVFAAKYCALRSTLPALIV